MMSGFPPLKEFDNTFWLPDPFICKWTIELKSNFLNFS